MWKIKITLINNFEITYNIIIQCPICYDYDVNCQINCGIRIILCGHMFCVHCYIKNNHIIGSKKYPIWHAMVDNNLII